MRQNFIRFILLPAMLLICSVAFAQEPVINQASGVKDILFRGRIFVESQTLAIVKIKFEI